jgi:hypothetical protein
VAWCALQPPDPLAALAPALCGLWCSHGRSTQATVVNKQAAGATRGAWAAQVQETLDTEVYAGAYECAGGGVATTKFRDCLAAPPAAGAQPYLWERRPLYCVRVPGEAAWAAGGAAASAPPISAAPAALVQRACPC